MPDQATVAQIVAGNIRRIRIRKGITQDGLAERAGLNKTHMYRIENAIQSPTMTTLERIAGALGVRMATLLRGCP
ncbi:MAG TPA: helix-turn-helix transcriptional regulator [Terracidiphilus sp.]|jgi:transcriptional regulator with XRE-family HTH domain